MARKLLVRASTGICYKKGNHKEIFYEKLKDDL